MKKEKTYTLQVTERELVFIAICRRMHSGYIEGIGVRNGAPNNLKGVTARIDLDKPDEIERILSSLDLATGQSLEAAIEELACRPRCGHEAEAIGLREFVSEQ